MNALVDSYMASKSSKVAEILSNMQEPNEKVGSFCFSIKSTCLVCSFRTTLDVSFSLSLQI